MRPRTANEMQAGTIARLVGMAALGSVVALVSACGGGGGNAGSHCVGTRQSCARTIQAAFDAAHDGDTIRVEPGTFRGPITIDKSLKLVGAGAGRTIITGGGPVVTIGRPSVPRTLTVSIAGVTITGGATTSDPRGRCGADVPTCGPGYLRATALGGGIEIAPGATVSIGDSVVTGNRAAPRATVHSVTASCPSGPCAFAQGGGGGIDNWGTLTLINTTISENAAGGGLTAQADGGGILSEANTRLTLDNSTVEGNRVFVAAPNARFATGGGIFVDNGGTLVVRRSTVSRNRVDLATAMPGSVDVNAQAAGIFLGDNTHATIGNSALSANAVTGSNTRGNGVFCRGALGTGEGGSFTLSDSTVSNNRVSAAARAASSTPGDFLACAGALDLFADTIDITRTRIVGNSVRASTSSGTALAVGGAMSAVAGSRATVSDSLFTRNSGTALSTTGSATVYAGAIHNGGTTELRRVTLTDNLARADAPKAVTRGGGIYSGLVPGLDSPPHLTVVHSVIARNKPDQCRGC